MQAQPQVPDWALLKCDPGSVKVISSYKGLQAYVDKHAKLFQLKGRVAVSLQALAEVLPLYHDKDFHLVARQNDKGIWCSEVWTKRSFEPLEIQLGPWSSQLKDSHLMTTCMLWWAFPKVALVHILTITPWSLTVQARTRWHLNGEFDEEEHTESLFWVVGRTSQVVDVNLVLENITFETQIKMSLPAPQKTHHRDLLFGFLHDAFSACPCEQGQDRQAHPAPCLSVMEEEGLW